MMNMSIFYRKQASSDLMTSNKFGLKPDFLSERFPLAKASGNSFQKYWNFILRSAITCLLLTAYCLLLSCGGPSERIKDIETQKSPTPTATPTEREISGVFNVSGTAANDTAAYNGVLTVAPSGDVYEFRWALNKGTFIGTGVQLGSVVAVSFASVGGGKGCGVTVYKITSDGSMEGRIAQWGEGYFGTEKVTRVEGDNFPGKYKVTGKTLDGKDYASDLIVKKDGAGYDFEWHYSDEIDAMGKRMVGFGIWKGSYAAVSFGGHQCSFALYDISSNGSLEGSWGGQKSVTFGKESAKRQ